MSSFHLPILLGAEAYCTAQNWELVFMSYRYSATTPTSELRLPQIAGNTSTVRAVILGGTNYVNMLKSLRERGMPFSVLGNNVVGDWNPDEFDTIYSDDIQGARDVTTHLLADGHRDIWFIGDNQLPWYARCSQGYRLAMQDAGCQPRFSEFHSDDRQLGYLAMRSILSREERVTAVFAGSDQIAVGVYEALRQPGVQVPNDISVAGFNNTDSKLLHPAATTVCEFPEELGKHLAEFALKRVGNLSMPPQHLTVPTQLIIRESTRPPIQSSSRKIDEPRISEQGIIL
jgi:DNA-binding LacI/PurR family transcriptional regulator